MLTTLYRNTLLTIADAAPVGAFFRRYGWRLGVGRFVAGERLDDALGVLEALQAEGRSGILDLLGEYVRSQEAACAATRDIERALEQLGHRQVERYFSVKPTQLGLAVDFELALSNARTIASKAREVAARLCLDMENAPYVDGTLRLFRALHNEGFRNIATVLQSYLKRTPHDLAALLELPDLELRIVKGAYKEPADIAYQEKYRVDDAYRELVFTGLEHGAKIDVATHDEALIREVAAFVRGARLGPDAYEFQLLFGVKPLLQQRLASAGHRVRIYVPYGRDWYGYFSRRLAERPANLAFVIRGLFG